MNQMTGSEYAAFVNALEKCAVCKRMQRCGGYCDGAFWQPSLLKLLNRKLKRWIIAKLKL